MPLEHIDFHIISYWTSGIWSLWHISFEETHCQATFSNKQHFSTDRTAHTTAFDVPVVDHWLEWKTAQLQVLPLCRIDLPCRRIQTFTAECSTAWATSPPPCLGCLWAWILAESNQYITKFIFINIYPGTLHYQDRALSGLLRIELMWLDVITAYDASSLFSQWTNTIDLIVNAHCCKSVPALIVP